MARRVLGARLAVDGVFYDLFGMAPTDRLAETVRAGRKNCANLERVTRQASEDLALDATVEKFPTTRPWSTAS